MTPIPTGRLVAALIATAVMVAVSFAHGAPAAAPAPTVPATTSTSSTTTTAAPTTTTPPATTTTTTTPPGDWQCPHAVTIAATVGFPADVLKTVDQIVYRESRCDAGALNDSYLQGGPDHSFGLWQINTKGDRLWADRAALCELDARDDLFDPITNTVCAFRLWERSGFGPWGR